VGVRGGLSQRWVLLIWKGHKSQRKKIRSTVECKSVVINRGKGRGIGKGRPNCEETCGIREGGIVCCWGGEKNEKWSVVRKYGFTQKTRL